MYKYIHINMYIFIYIYGSAIGCGTESMGQRTENGVVMPTVLPTVGRRAPTKQRALGPYGLS